MATTEPDDDRNAASDQLQEIARAAVRRSVARRDEEAKRVEQARQSHERRFATAVAALELGVIPVLEKAKLTFESEGMPAQISTNFEHVTAPQAHVIFECCGSFMSDVHGEVALAASARAIVFHDGNDLHVGMAKSFGTDVASRTRVVGDVVPHVLAALEEVVESFFMDVERRCRATGR